MSDLRQDRITDFLMKTRREGQKEMLEIFKEHINLGRLDVHEIKQVIDELLEDINKKLAAAPDFSDLLGGN